MKIAFINHDAGAYGAPKSLLGLIDGLIARKVNCYVIVPHYGPLVAELEKRGVKYKIIPYARWVHKRIPHTWRKAKSIIRRFLNNRLLRAIKNTRAIPQIKNQIQEWNADIVYTNSSVVPIGAIAAYQLGKPHVWHIREFQKLDQGLVLDWGKVSFKKLIKKSDAVIFISQALRQYYESFLKVRQGFVVYNGVASAEDFNKIKLQKASYHKPHTDAYLFCIVGRIVQEKGQAEAIKALAKLVNKGRDVKLIVAGLGNYGELKGLATSLEVEDRVIFVGHTDDPFSIYLQSDACLMCSSHEAFGRVTVEAMTTAIPVIGKKNIHSGTQELIKHGYSGLLYQGNESELATAMEQLLDNPEWGKELGMHGWKYAKEHFNKERYVDHIFKILEDLTSKES